MIDTTGRNTHPPTRRVEAMAKKKTTALDRIDRVQQWKVVRGVELKRLEYTCEEWAANGWTVFAILGPFSDGLAVVLNRIITL